MSQIVLMELYVDNVGSDDDDNEASFSKLCPSVDDPLCINADGTSIFYEENNTSAIFDKEAFSNDEDKSVGAQAGKESSAKEATSLGRHETGKEPNINSEVVNLNSTVPEKDTSHDHELITIIECKEETTDFDEDTDRIVYTDSTEDRGTVVKETKLSQNQETFECKEEMNENEETNKIANTDRIDDSETIIIQEMALSHIQELLDCKKEPSDYDYEDTEAIDPIDSTVDDYPIIKETLLQHGQDTYESQEELSADNHCGDINETVLSQRQELLADFDMFVSHHRENRPVLESHCVHCGHELSNDKTPHRDSHLQACGACGEHFREQTLQQRDSTQQDNPIFSTNASIKEKSCKNYYEKESSYFIKILNNGKSKLIWKYFKCNHCHKQFKLKSRLQKHMLGHYDVYPFLCKFCDAKFKVYGNWIGHLNSDKHVEFAPPGITSCLRIQKYFECDHCHKQFKRKLTLQQHMAMHYDVYPFYCKLCDAKFKRHCYWKQHLKTSKHARVAAGETSSVKIQKYFKCHYCHKQFKLKYTLQQHMASHHDVYPFYCKFCDENFRIRSDWIKHLKSSEHATAAPGETSNLRMQNFECDHCHKLFKFKYLLQKHIAIHYDVYPFYCKLCDAKFKRSCHWNRHLMSSKHARAAACEPSNLKLEKYFECDHCHKQFKLKYRLQEHMLVHYDIYPFFCKFCDAKFKQRSHWIGHLYSGKHTKLAPPGETSSLRIQKYFECDHCHKQFKFKYRLQEHMLVHYDVYPFFCKFCDAKFKRYSNWIGHLKSSKHAKLAPPGETST